MDDHIDTTSFTVTRTLWKRDQHNHLLLKKLRLRGIKWFILRSHCHLNGRMLRPDVCLLQILPVMSNGYSTCDSWNCSCEPWIPRNKLRGHQRLCTYKGHSRTDNFSTWEHPSKKPTSHQKNTITDQALWGSCLLFSQMGPFKLAVSSPAAGEFQIGLTSYLTYACFSFFVGTPSSFLHLRSCQ